MFIQNGVESVSRDYKNNIAKWSLNRLIQDSDIILPENWKKHLFYPASWVSQASKEIVDRQNDFIKGATLFPALKRTLDGSLGVVFRKPTKVKLSPQLEYMRLNADGNNKGIEQLVQDSTLENVLQGYGALLVDYPEVEGVVSQAQRTSKGLQTTIQIYQAESIRRVYTKKIGARVVVWQIILQEEYEVQRNQFDSDTRMQYRVLKLEQEEESSVYVQEIYRPEEKELKDQNYLYSVVKPKANGKFLDYIPLAFFGSECNDYKVDSSPLYPMAYMNAKHLELSAVRNESIRRLPPTMFIYPGEGFDSEQFSEDNPDGIILGAYGSYNLGTGGKAEIVQAKSNDAAVDEMRHIEELMVQAGALLIKPSSSNVSTDTTIIQRSTDTSVLGVAVRNIENAFNLALEWVSQFEGATDISRIDINREFFAQPMTANDRQRWADDILAGNVTLEEYRDALNKAGTLPDSAMDNNEILDPIQDNEASQASNDNESTRGEDD